jgi:1-acyl-sn-glycerol-3-phosphate acyltransferase
MSIYTLILKLGRWKLDDNFRNYNGSCVMLGVPHTSNWDAVYSLAAFNAIGIPVKFTIKKEWLKFPFKHLWLSMGAIPIDRSPKMAGQERISMTEAMINLFKETKPLVVLVTPEGTRSKREEWKTGFYHVALGAGVPIGLGYLDYKKRIAGVSKFVMPSGDMAKDMHEIMEFYAHIEGKNPLNFSVDKRYYP